jgi:hypothetical protein
MEKDPRGAKTAFRFGAHEFIRSRIAGIIVSELHEKGDVKTDETAQYT